MKNTNVPNSLIEEFNPQSSRAPEVGDYVKVEHNDITIPGKLICGYIIATTDKSVSIYYGPTLPIASIKAIVRRCGREFRAGTNALPINIL